MVSQFLLTRSSKVLLFVINKFSFGIQHFNATYRLSTNSHHFHNLFHMNDITKIFGERVRYFRKLQKLSQEDLASACDLHRTYVGGIERGERNASLKNVERIAKALNVSFANLLTIDKVNDGF